MKVQLETRVSNSIESEWLHISFGTYGFRLPKELATRLLVVLTSYYDGTIKMSGSTTPDSLKRFFTDDADIRLWDERPRNPQHGGFTNGTIGFQFNNGTGYFELSDNDAKELLKALERELA